MLTFELVVLIAIAAVLALKANPFEMGLSYLALLAGVAIVGLMTNTRTGLVVSVLCIFGITLFIRYSGVSILETMSVNTAAQLVALFLIGVTAGRLGRTIGQIQRQANHWMADTEAQTVHDKTFGTLKPAWAEIRLKEEIMRAEQFGRPLSVLLLRVCPESNGSPKAPHDRIAVLQAIVRLSRSLTQPPAVVTCTDENQVLLILPEHTGEQANELRQELSEQLTHVLYFPDKETKSLGKALSQWGKVHIGLISLNGHDTTAKMLVPQPTSKLTKKLIEYRVDGTQNILTH
jgi:hypothetical protein